MAINQLSTLRIGCIEVASDLVRQRDKDRVAVRVGLFTEALLKAYALDDVEFPRPLAEKDPRRLPWLGEHMRRDDLEIIVQDVRRGQMNALDDVHVAVIGNAHRLAHGNIGLRPDADGVDNQCVALPMADRMAVERRVW